MRDERRDRGDWRGVGRAMAMDRARTLVGDEGRGSPGEEQTVWRDEHSQDDDSLAVRVRSKRV